MNARDIAIRTILGEAMGEGPMGQAAVAHVLQNRARDPRWPSTVGEVALQPKQFSAWNSGAGGNDLVSKYGPESDPYKQAGLIYDAVARGEISDPTGGATHYYSPAGMDALVAQGAQSNTLPRWLTEQNEMRGAAPATIGGHVFTGLAQGTEPGTTFLPKEGEESGALAGVLEWLESDDGQGFTSQLIAQPQEKPMQLAPPPPPAQIATRRDTVSPYLDFFGGLYG